ncbi:MAG: PKD domain-containing protein [Chitinophagales bacterium]
MKQVLPSEIPLNPFTYQRLRKLFAGVLCCVTVLLFTEGLYAQTTITWNGSQSTDWQTAANWSPAMVPSSCAHNVVIPYTANQPVVDTDIAVGSVTMAAGTHLTLNDGMAVCGNWIGPDSATARVSGMGLVVLNGSGQLVKGNTGFDLLSMRGAGVTKLDTGAYVDIYVALQLENGTFETTNGTMRFRSSSSSDMAVLDNFSPGFVGTLVGDIVAERVYDAAGYEDAHYFGSPVDGITAGYFGSTNAVGGFVTATGNCDETLLAPNSIYGNVYTYDESNGAGCNVAGWHVEPAGAMMDAGKGFSVRMIGAGAIAVNGAPHLDTAYTRDATNGGWANVSLQGRPTVSGWTMVANPYLATLDLTANVVPGFDAVNAIWNVSGPYAGAYINENLIAPFQAFFVRKTIPGGTSTYTIRKSSLSRNSQTFHAVNNSETITMVFENTTNGLLDKTTIGFNENASAQFDNQFDGVKLPGALTRHTVYTYNTDPLEWYSQNVNKAITQTPAVNVGFEPGVSGNYKISVTGLQSFDPTTYIILKDKKAGVYHNLREGDYSFAASTNDDWHRFVLHFTPKAEIKTMNASCAAAGQISVEQPGTAAWQYVIREMQNGGVISQGTLTSSSPISLSANAGVYQIELTDNDGYTVIKNIQIQGAAPMIATMHLSNANPETGEEIQLETAGDVANAQWDFGDGTIQYGLAVAHTYQQQGAYTLALTVTNNEGCSASTQQIVNVTAKTTTDITSVANQGINMWSSSADVFIDFRQLKNVKAHIDIYNLLGQKVWTDDYMKPGLYAQALDDVGNTYVIVQVNTNGVVNTKKLLLKSSK